MNLLDNIKKLNKKFSYSKNIFIMGHTDLDLDALGSSLGMYEYLTKNKKKCFMIIDDKTNELVVSKVLNKVRTEITLITSENVKEYMHTTLNRNLLLILDTNKTTLLSNSDLLNLFEEIIVIDHHELNKHSITKGLIIIDNNASSTCEMIAELIAYYNIKLSSLISTILLSGIVLDTNNFMLKTTSKTYYMAYYLTNLGADPKEVQYLLKQDLKQYIERQKTITNVKVLNKNIAISLCSSRIIYRREDLAKIADTLLLFNEIEASFVIGKISDTIVGISSRSMGNIKIHSILESLGGGGDRYNAASKIENRTLKEVEKELIDVIIKQEGSL